MVETGKRRFFFVCSGSKFPLMKLLASLTGCLAAIIKDHAFGVQILQGDVESLEGLGDFSPGRQSADGQDPALFWAPQHSNAFNKLNINLGQI